MSKDDSIYLGHMLDMAKKINVRIRDKSRKDYDQDEDLIIVIAHLVQTIGEAAARDLPILLAQLEKIVPDNG